ncbi:CHASE2 domain-containing protein [Lyngbya aestuarii]|uniref:CHASE2 domain-containing protein n=1 Tax=Lyngbya aestuarii TaxID=118322 RepID=UPI00403DC2D3
MAIWRAGSRPGIVVLGLVITARLTGSLQFLEWLTFDTLLRLRPVETVDERIVIIGIDEADIRTVGAYPIPDQEIAKLLRKLQSYNPRAIGLDIVRDLPVEPGHAELVAAFKNIKNIIAIEKVLPTTINPPPTLPSEQLGFSDTILDADGNIRRSLLGTHTEQGYKFSLPLKLAQSYLAAEDITLKNGIHDHHAMRFGSTELPRLSPNYGGYVLPDAGGVQVLLNFRNGRERFRTLSLNNIKNGNFNPSWIRDRVILIGITSPGVNDIVKTSAIANLNPPGQIYGVEFQAHATSQIISAVKDGRVLLNVWSDGWEYLWILGWGFLAINLGQFSQSPSKNFLLVGIASAGLLLVAYVFLINGWWIPVAPVLIVLIINGVALGAFYQYDQALKSQIEVSQRTIEHTFNVIHNGPLQTLAYVMRGVRDEDLSQEQLLAKLENINQEIREVGEYLKLEALTKERFLRLGSGLKLDLEPPLHELLYAVYRDAVERDFPGFETIKVKAINFEPIEPHPLSIEEKRELCQFLEEALCNVGKHAKAATRLSVTGTQNDGCYTLSIKDNGSGVCSSSEGQGTKHCRNLAKHLKGEFKREPISPRGTLCELTWSLVASPQRKVQLGNRLKTIFLKSVKS